MFKKLITGLALSTALAGGALALCATTASAESNPNTWETTTDCPSTWRPCDKKEKGDNDVHAHDISTGRQRTGPANSDQGDITQVNQAQIVVGGNDNDQTVKVDDDKKKHDDKKKPVCCEPWAVQ
jgi:hypothetical protein